MAKANVNQDLCVGCGVCAGLCPESFKLNEEGKSQFISGNEENCDIDMVAKSCPVGAIQIES